MRARLGAGAAYALWLMVPLGLALCCWPRHQASLPVLALSDDAGGAADVRVRLVCDGKPAGAPRLMAKRGEPVTIAVGRTEKRPDGSYVTAKGFRPSMRVDRA